MKGVGRMQTTYGRKRRSAQHKDKGRKKQGGGRQLVQLLVCLAVFLAVFIGKGVWPSKVAQTGEQLLAVIRANTDFRAAFASLGQALSQQESVLGEIGQFCAAVFAPAQQSGETELAAVSAAALKREARPVDADQNQLTARYLNLEELPKALMVELPVQSEPALQVGDVVQTVEIQQDLPEGYSGQWLWLGDIETVTPVLGTVTSNFGYRDHPTIGRYAAHGGVDIAADKGTQVAAFAEGVVEGVGEDNDFGKYLYLTHPNGVTTFYAHCSKVCVQEGEQVQAGQTVALVGSTGKSTGPHLHFEVRLNGVRLDPIHYITPGQEV